MVRQLLIVLKDWPEHRTQNTEHRTQNTELHDLDFARTALGKQLKKMGERAMALDNEIFKIVMGVEKDYWQEYSRILSSSFFELELSEYIVQCQFLLKHVPEMLKGLDSKKRQGIFSSAHFIPDEVEKMEYDKADVKRIILILSDEQEHWNRFSGRLDKRQFVEDNMEECFLKIRNYQKFLVENSKGTDTMLIENDETAVGEIEKIIGG